MTRVNPLLVASLGASLVLSGCGLFSRQAEVFDGLRAARLEEDVVARDAQLAELRGLAPTSPLPWLESAFVESDRERALELVEQALAFDPSNPELHFQRIGQIARSQQLDDQLSAVDEALRASPWAAPTESIFREIRVETLLALGRLDETEDELKIYGGLNGVTPAKLATGWAQLALVAAVNGDMAQSDRAFDLSLAQGVDGVGALRRESLRHPEAAAAAALVVQRGSERHFDHPDLLLYQVVDHMLAGNIERAEGELSVLPQPLPERLVGSVDMVQARIDIAAGRIDAGLAALAERLDRIPDDPDALNLLLASYAGMGQPSVDVVRVRLQRAIGATRSINARRDLEALLAQLPASDA